MREIKFRVWEENIKQMFYNAGIVNDELYLMLDGIGFDVVGDYREFKLMQFTGLKDKNGKEIYEGDIVRHATDEGIYKVIFEDGGFYVKNLFEYDFQTINEYPLEVIGNIYENPELLGD